MRQIWLASFTYGKANLDRVEVIKETPKTFTVGPWRETRRTLGWQSFPERFSKETYCCFVTLKEAMEYLVKTAQEYVKQCRDELTKAKEEHHTLVELSQNSTDPKKFEEFVADIRIERTRRESQQRRRENK